MNKFKNILIFVLALFAIYLTEWLWFDEISGHNFFYSLRLDPLKLPTIETSNSSFSDPYRIVTNFGNGTFVSIYEDIENSPQKDQGTEFITFMLRRGRFIKSSEIDWDYVFKNRSFIYDYNFAMPSDLFVESFNLNGNILTSRFDSFTSIVFVPNMDSDERLIIIFLDEERDMMHEFTLDNQILSTNILKTINSIQSDNSYPILISSKQSAFRKFKKNIFIPQIEMVNFPLVKKNNPYTENRSALLYTIRGNILNFFDNPASVWDHHPNDVFIYSDENTVVKYFGQDILEYSDYRPIDKSNSNSVVRNYESAINFIRSDDKIINNYFLSKFETDNNKHTFYFDLTINNYPILLSEEYLFNNDLALQSSIEVTVENESIIQYKKLAYNYESVKTDLETNVSFVNFLNQIDRALEVDEAGEINFSSILMGYKVEKRNNLQNEDLKLYWRIVDMNMKQMFVAAVKDTEA